MRKQRFRAPFSTPKAVTAAWPSHLPPRLNLGIVAHVDAGKTTLTERLLYETGVSTHLGRVDHGDTVTDADAIERRRGITIRSAVVAFTRRTT